MDETGLREACSKPQMGDLIGGERPLPPSKLRSPLLQAHGRQLAADCFRRCFETWPELDERYGARGRQHAAEDAFWHLEHLDAAVAAGSPRIFADYADWLAGLLEARGIGREQVAGAFGFLAEGIEGVDCPPNQEGHRRELVSFLRDNQARILRPAQPHRSGGPS
jgi:hypothetical protein